MRKLATKLPKEINIAFSGGSDSVSIVMFFLRSNKKPNLYYFNHGTQHSKKENEFVNDFAKKHKLNLTIGYRNEYSNSTKNSEEEWRRDRYNFFRSTNKELITCHHLNDAIEWWLFTSMRGNPSLLPKRRENPNIIRPFLFHNKEEINSFRGNEEFLTDESNFNEKYSRSNIRMNVVPHVYKINPGIEKTIINLYNKINDK